MNNSHEGKILNALRMGVIPDIKLQHLIAGRKIESEELQNVFDTIEHENSSLVKFIKGEYGSGKTFMLSYIRQLALERNYVVANLSIHSGFDFSKLDILYLNIMSHLSLNDSSGNGTDFEGLFSDWLKSLKMKKGNSEASKAIYEVIASLNAYNVSFSTVLLTYIRAKISNDYELASIAASWITGDKNISYELKKRLGIKGSIDRENALEMLQGFAKLVKLIGFRGLLITVDEAEIMMTSRSDIRMKAYSNIRHIMDICGANELENTCFVLAGTDDLFMNQDKGFRSYEALQQRIGEVTKDYSKIINHARQPILYLRPLGNDDYFEILESVYKVHKSFYGYESVVDADVLYHLTKAECIKIQGEEELTPRLFIKKLLEVLDMMEKNPELPIFKIKMKKVKA